MTCSFTDRIYRLLAPSVREPVESGIAKWVYRQTSQEVCPWNVSFTTALRESAFAPRAMLLDAGSGEGTRALAREIDMMGPADYATAFKGRAIKRAKLRMLQRNAWVVLGNVGTDEDLAVLETMLAHEHDVVRENAAWAVACIARIASRSRR